ncbi:unnamed protein product, partial [marine sediment metagenome]
ERVVQLFEDIIISLPKVIAFNKQDLRDKFPTSVFLENINYFKFYLDWVTEADVLNQGMRTNIYVQVAKITSAPVYGAKVQLSGPPEVNIVVTTRKIHPKKSTNKLSFPISAEEPGLFTLTATLTSDAGHRIAFPFNIRVKSTKNLYREETPADGTPATTATYSTPSPTTSQDLTGARIIFGIIGVILLFAGGALSISGGFGSGLSFGITLIVIGVIATRMDKHVVK